MTMPVFLLAAAVGGIILFAWGVLARVILPLHRPFLKRFHGEEEDRVRMALREGGPVAGLYLVPGMPGERAADPEKRRAIEEIHRERVREGPVAVIALRPAGVTRRSGEQLLTGLAIQLAAAFLATLVLDLASAEGTSYAVRLLIVLATGITAWVVSHATYWNWMHFPGGFIVSQLLDLAIGWTLLGLWLAWVAAP